MTEINEHTDRQTPDFMAWLQSALFNRKAVEYFHPLLTALNPLSGPELKAQVLGVYSETNSAKRLRLKPRDNWNGFLPGQYISITLEVNGKNIQRHYSICSELALWENEGLIDIAVQQAPNGEMSNWIAHHIKSNAVIRISQATGEFTSKENATPKLFIAGGSGITAIFSMLINRDSDDPAPTVIYTARGEGNHLFKNQLTHLNDTKMKTRNNLVNNQTNDNAPSVILHDSIDGRLNEKTIREYCPDLADRSIYICGSHKFTSGINQILSDIGIEKEAIHSEAFINSGDLHTTATLPSSDSLIEFTRSKTQIQDTRNKTVLELAEAAQLNPKAGCRSGICHQCKCRKTSGIVMNALTGVESSSGMEDIQACISFPIGHVKIEL
ncbi:MAG: iron-sulfur cluster-binding domain-containing protein [Pseudomonadales bacterium]|nr:iron-sulfur cluster-binding domain-containing protein [Pseudomonadales bacterium]